MKISSAFPSKYLKASDLPDGQFISVMIDRVEMEDVGGKNDEDDMKPVMYFAGKNKGIVMNKTKSNTIGAVYGDDTDNWRGKPLLISAGETSFAGKPVACINVKVPKQAAQTAASTTPIGDKVRAEQAARDTGKAPYEGEPDTFKGDDIPF